jgi:aryl-alcohol dehydrogenase-like predicted oxidoreductase
VHPITAVQSEYSLWTRDVETDVLDALRELSVGLVLYSPLGRGFLTGTVDISALDANDFRANTPASPARRQRSTGRSPTPCARSPGDRTTGEN